MHQQARTHGWFFPKHLRIGQEPLCPGTTTTTGAWGSRGAITPLRLPASRRWTHFGEVDRVSLRQFYGWSANRRAKLCVSTFPCVQRQIVMSPLVAVQCVTKSYGQQPSKLSIVCRSRLVWANWSG